MVSFFECDCLLLDREHLDYQILGPNVTNKMVKMDIFFFVLRMKCPKCVEEKVLYPRKNSQLFISLYIGT